MTTKNKDSIEKRFNEVYRKINFDSLKDKPKLLIISCSDEKRNGGFSDNNFNNYFKNINYNFLLAGRELRQFHYLDYMEINPNYFLYKDQNRPILRDLNGNNLFHQVIEDYFLNCLHGNNYMPAFERYSGIYYDNDLRTLYFNKNRDSKLHILIISGLYGVLEFRDEIVDYHFEIKNKPNIWGNCLTKSINQYINENQIDHNSVFYSLSDEYLKNINTNNSWMNIWIKNGKLGSLRASAKFLKEYFLPNL